MVDTPESDAKHDQPDSNLEKIGATPQTTDATQPDNKEQQPKQHRDYSEYVMRPLKAVGRATIIVVNWLDEKGPFVTAIATVIIAILTGFYVHYSRAQWKVMRDQLPELKTSAEAAKDAATTAAKQLEMSERPWVILT